MCARSGATRRGEAESGPGAGSALLMGREGANKCTCWARAEARRRPQEVGSMRAAWEVRAGQLLERGVRETRRRKEIRRTGGPRLNLGMRVEKEQAVTVPHQWLAPFRASYSNSFLLDYRRARMPPEQVLGWCPPNQPCREMRPHRQRHCRPHLCFPLRARDRDSQRSPRTSGRTTWWKALRAQAINRVEVLDRGECTFWRIRWWHRGRRRAVGFLRNR